MLEWVPEQVWAYICHLSYAILCTHLHTYPGCTHFHGEKEPFRFIQLSPAHPPWRCGTWHWSMHTFSKSLHVVISPSLHKPCCISAPRRCLYIWIAPSAQWEELMSFHTGKQAFIPITKPVSLSLRVLHSREIWAVWVFSFWATEQLC